MTRKPNLFIIGAPKCGTTAWYEYLRRHKDIAFSKAKEPHYFSDDFQGFRWAHSEEEYLQLFEGLPPTKYTGEASVMYLFSEVAVEKIRQFQPDAKILIFLRNYADFVKSYHAQIYRTHDEDQVDLETAWKLQAAREQGKSIPVDCRESRFLQYREVCAFGKQLERVYRQFPREQVKVVIFEEWINQPQEMYGEILDFLELENDGFTDFKKVNVKRESRFRWLGRLMHRPPPFLLSTARIVRKILGIKRLGLAETIKQLNERPEQKQQEITDEFKHQIRSEMKLDLELLESLVGHQITCWP